MVSLIVTIVAVALVALLALATLYYGANALSKATPTANAATLLQQSAQVLGAAEVFHVEKQGWSESTEDLLTHEYLKTIPVYMSGVNGAQEWEQPMPGVPTFWVLNSTDADTCRQVNLRARGDNGVYTHARPGLITQCFGDTAPFTTVTTRQGMGHLGFSLDVVFNFFNGKNGSSVGYADDGGAWALEPDEFHGVSPNEVPQPGDTGTSSGSYADGAIQITLPGAGDLNSNVVTIGSISANGSKTIEVAVTNNGAKPLEFPARPSVTEPFTLVGSSCQEPLQSGQSCLVSVQLNPREGVTEVIEVNGVLTIPTSEAQVKVAIKGTVVPAVEGPVQLGISTSDPRDTQSALIFPDTQVGQTSTKWVQLENVGSPFNLTAQAMGLVAPFGLVSSNCVGSMPKGATCMAELSFTPSSVTTYGPANHKFTLTAGGQSVGVGLSGRGIPAPVEGFSVSPSVQDFGTRIALGSYVNSYYINIHNDGDVPLTFAQAPYISKGSEAFAVESSTCSTGLSPGNSCSVRLKFIPDATTLFTGELSVEMTGLPAQVVTLKGTASNPLISKAMSLANARVDDPYTSADLAGGWQLMTAGYVPSQLKVGLAAGNTLPEGLTLDSNARVLEGTPTASGVYPFTLSGTYQGKFKADSPFALTVQPAALKFKALFSNNGQGNICGLTTTNALACWGLNQSRTLGLGHAVAVVTPVISPQLSEGMAAISFADTAACAVKLNGTVLCWGENTWNVFDDGATSVQAPTVMPSMQGASQVALVQHTVCILRSGSVYCRGRNNTGNLGQSNRTDYGAAWLRVPISETVTALEAGVRGACALATNNLYCWGGAGTDGINLKLEKSNAVAVSVSDSVTCYITTTGGSACTGSNYYYNYGNGQGSSASSSTSWTASGWSPALKSIAVGGRNTCAITTDNQLYCWGTTRYYALTSSGSESQVLWPTFMTAGATKATTSAWQVCVIDGNANVLCRGLNTGRQSSSESQAQQTFTPML